MDLVHEFKKITSEFQNLKSELMGFSSEINRLKTEIEDKRTYLSTTEVTTHNSIKEYRRNHEKIIIAVKSISSIPAFKNKLIELNHIVEIHEKVFEEKNQYMLQYNRSYLEDIRKHDEQLEEENLAAEKETLKRTKEIETLLTNMYSIELDNITEKKKIEKQELVDEIKLLTDEKDQISKEHEDQLNNLQVQLEEAERPLLYEDYSENFQKHIEEIKVTYEKKLQEIYNQSLYSNVKAKYINPKKRKVTFNLNDNVLISTSSESTSKLSMAEGTGVSTFSKLSTLGTYPNEDPEILYVETKSSQPRQDRAASTDVPPLDLSSSSVGDFRFNWTGGRDWDKRPLGFPVQRGKRRGGTWDKYL